MPTPAKLRFLHALPVAPKSNALFVVGTKSDANSPPMTTSSVSESPGLMVPPLKVTFPIKVDNPAT